MDLCRSARVPKDEEKWGLVVSFDLRPATLLNVEVIEAGMRRGSSFVVGSLAVVFLPPCNLDAALLSRCLAVWWVDALATTEARQASLAYQSPLPYAELLHPLLADRTSRVLH